MKIQDLKKNKIPDKPGIYFFMKGKTILYIGKATSLKDRTKSYFGKDLIVTRGPMILDMVVQADNIKWEVTDSVLEALILEASLIKKHLPKYNVKEKDDKSWNYVYITDEKLPKVLVVRGRNIEIENKKNKAIFGPFTNGLQLRESIKIIRPIFPFIDGESLKKNNTEFYRQLGLTPESILEYKNNIKNLKLFFQGKKKKIIQNLKKDMMLYAKNREFEQAGEIKRQLFALQHINDIALIREDVFAMQKNSLGQDESSARRRKLLHSENVRIEAYDIAHMSGKNMVGVMTVIENGEVKKSEYKKFIIKTQTGANDTGALSEVLLRRLKHIEWGMPNLIVVDGGLAQINVAQRVLSFYRLKIDVVSVVKDDKHRAKAVLGDEKIILRNRKLILLVNSEAHRFAIKFYRQKSRRNMFE